jgi:hypothetical protein
MSARVTVRREWSRDRTRFGVRGNPQASYVVERAWRVYRDGERLDCIVVDARPGRTLVDLTDYARPVMTTCWHAGIGPGDLARHCERFGRLPASVTA